MIRKTARSSKQAKGSVRGARSKQAARNPPPAPLSKSETIRNLLARPGGASIPELSEATGWQAHSVRGYLSGTLKKKLGLTLTSSKEESGRRYRLTRPGNS